MRPRIFHAGQSRALALFMRAMRPRTSHAGLAPAHLSCALAPYMRANHVPSHLLWANHEPSYLSCGPITSPRRRSDLSCRPIFHESTSYFYGISLCVMRRRLLIFWDHTSFRYPGSSKSFGPENPSGFHPNTPSNFFTDFKLNTSFIQPPSDDTHRPAVLPRIGVHTAAYVGVLVGIMSFFAGLAVWGALS